MQYAALCLSGIGLLLIAIGGFAVALGDARYRDLMVAGMFAIMLSAVCGLLYLCLV